MSRATAAMLLLCAVGLLGPDRVAAQGMVQVDVTTATIAFPAPGIADFEAGWIDHGGLELSVTSRPGAHPWELRIRASDAVLGQGKPVSHLQWRLDGSGAWTSLSVTDATILQSTGDGTVTVHFRMLLNWSGDSPGSYSTGLDFTVVRL